MKLPRGVSANRLIRALEQLRHEDPPVHMITVPLHNSLKTGTLHGILSEVALMRSVEVESLAELL